MYQVRLPGIKSIVEAFKPTMHDLKKFVLAKLYDQLGGGLPRVGDTTMRRENT
jgi:hypothetical protein